MSENDIPGAGNSVREGKSVGKDLRVPLERPGLFCRTRSCSVALRRSPQPRRTARQDAPSSLLVPVVCGTILLKVPSMSKGNHRPRSLGFWGSGCLATPPSIPWAGRTLRALWAAERHCPCPAHATGAGAVACAAALTPQGEEARADPQSHRWLLWGPWLGEPRNAPGN